MPADDDRYMQPRMASPRIGRRRTTVPRVVALHPRRPFFAQRPELPRPRPGSLHSAGIADALSGAEAVLGRLSSAERNQQERVQTAQQIEEPRGMGARAA
ncbi:MAG: hypothetical protein V4673_00830 [Pseudomonadota bacterium]